MLVIAPLEYLESRTLTRLLIVPLKPRTKTPLDYILVISHARNLFISTHAFDPINYNYNSYGLPKLLSTFRQLFHHTNRIRSRFYLFIYLSTPDPSLY